MNTIQTYLDLITSEHQDKTNFSATVSLSVQPQVQVQNLLTDLIAALDINDTVNCVGVFLDFIGQWVGVSRNVSIPITGVYFSFDGTAYDGWDYGVWQPDLLPTDVTVLPDDVYRTLIRAKIAANQWDGTTNGAYAIWSAVFPTINILIQDYQDMTIAIAIVGGIIDSLTLALLTGGAIPLKPEGVLVREYFIPISSDPLFAWDTTSTYLAGWDTGFWAREVAPT